MVKIKGYFKDCIFEAENYAVYYFENSDITIVVTGDIGEINYELEYEIDGEYVEHPRYGVQFKINFLKAVLPTENQAIVDFLSSSIFKGIGRKLAKNIANKLIDDDLFFILKHPEVLDDIPKLTIQHKQNLIDVLSTFSPESQKLYLLFQSCGIAVSKIKNLFAFYKDEVYEVIFKNPYQLLIDFKSFSFLNIDKLAFKLNLKADDLNRLAAAITYLVMKICFNKGDSYVQVTELKSEYSKTDLNVNKFDEALKLACDNKTIYIENDYVFHHSQYLSEINIADFLKKFNEKNLFDQKLIKDEIKICESINKLKYSKTQLEAIENFFYNSFSMITGGPGCGKTTVIKAICSIYKNLFSLKKIVVLAPTGRAAKRIQELCGVEAKTIHSLLVWLKNENDFIYNKENPYFIDALIIDEFSMVDPYLFSCLINGISGLTKMAVIGDSKQLSSISCGNLLNDLIETNLFNHVHLENNYRQKSGNDIIYFSNDILNNCINFEKYKNNVFEIKLNKENPYQNLIELVSYFLSQNYNLNEIQILAPMYKGVLGIDNLNIFLQKAFNPESKDKKEIKFSKYIYRENDKVIQNKNRSDLDIYNGDIGFIKKIDDSDPKNILLYIDFDGNLIEYCKKDLEDISLAYAISIHKSQGSEYQVVIVSCVKEHGYMLDKQILYTAVTRAKKYCYVLGDSSFFISKAKINKGKRKTFLTNRILNN